ncbi:MAG TPA: elongation factor Ts [Rhodospirillaceae bacterium]|nr:elongation factor Ts [Candidatus Neomarinimicrobiota bacterium]HCX14941.1 elongation factor Ts [Rhodospirillaceae bacterium]
MAKITAQLVKGLRDKTGAGMMDCKKALEETNGDTESAVDWLRKKGLSAAAKKSGRIAADGLIGVAVNETAEAGAILEINAETDFVARNETFQKFVATVTQLTLDAQGVLENVNESTYPGEDRTVSEQLTHTISTIGENMAIRRGEYISVGRGVVSAYVHSAAKPGLGRIGVLVALESLGDKSKLKELGKQLAMHIAAANPQFLESADVDAATLEREKAIYRDQATTSGKPADIIEKMIEGRMRKYYEEVVLLEQAYIMAEKTKVSQAVEAAAKDIGEAVKIAGFVRYGLGEGIQKEESDFVSEVAAVAGT